MGKLKTRNQLAWEVIVNLIHIISIFFLNHGPYLFGSTLLQPPRQSLVGYKHVVDVNCCPPVPSMGPHFPPEAAPNVENTFEYHEIMEGRTVPDQIRSHFLKANCSWLPVPGMIAEEMIRGLQQLGWRKVDVSFHSAWWPFLAHNNMNVSQFCYFPNPSPVQPFVRFLMLLEIRSSFRQVKNEWRHSAGVGVVAHVADSLKQQESSPCVSASS